MNKRNVQTGPKDKIKRKKSLPYIIDLGKDSKGHRGQSTDQAYHEDNLAGSFESSHSVGVNRPAYCQIPLTGEGEDCEDRCVLRHLGHHGPHPAADLAQLPGILVPVDREVKCHPHEQCRDVGTGQREDEQVSRGPHGDVLEDDKTDHAVTERPCDPHQHVDGC